MFASIGDKFLTKIETSFQMNKKWIFYSKEKNLRNFPKNKLFFG